jgi:hypothetical protein
VGGSHRTVDRILGALETRGAIRHEVGKGGYHTYYEGRAGGGFGAAFETRPEPASSTPHADFRGAASTNPPLLGIPGGAGSGRVKPCAHPAPVEPWSDGGGWTVCGVCSPNPGGP